MLNIQPVASQAGRISAPCQSRCFMGPKVSGPFCYKKPPLLRRGGFELTFYFAISSLRDLFRGGNFSFISTMSSQFRPQREQ